ncbi:MAG: hypothetical protein HY606_14295 [Planctomycetes bacterium]|nr:hypothetical protein [Planctomycetota bacterium]
MGTEDLIYLLIAVIIFGGNAIASIFKKKKPSTDSGGPIDTEQPGEETFGNPFEEIFKPHEEKKEPETDYPTLPEPRHPTELEKRIAGKKPESAYPKLKLKRKAKKLHPKYFDSALDDELQPVSEEHMKPLPETRVKHEKINLESALKGIRQRVNPIDHLYKSSRYTNAQKLVVSGIILNRSSRFYALQNQRTHRT